MTDVDAATVTAVAKALFDVEWGKVPPASRPSAEEEMTDYWRESAEAAVRAVLGMQRACPNPKCIDGGYAELAQWVACPTCGGLGTVGPRYGELGEQVGWTTPDGEAGVISLSMKDRSGDESWTEGFTEPVYRLLTQETKP